MMINPKINLYFKEKSKIYKQLDLNVIIKAFSLLKNTYIKMEVFT